MIGTSSGDEVLSRLGIAVIGLIAEGSGERNSDEIALAESLEFGTTTGLISGDEC